MDYKCRHSLTWSPKRCFCFRRQSHEQPPSTGQSCFLYPPKAPSGWWADFSADAMIDFLWGTAKRVGLSETWAGRVFELLAKENTTKKRKRGTRWKSTASYDLNSPSHHPMKTKWAPICRCSSRLSKKTWQPRGRSGPIGGLVWERSEGRRLGVWSFDRNGIQMLSCKHWDPCYTEEAHQQANEGHSAERLFGLPSSACLWII